MSLKNASSLSLYLLPVLKSGKSEVKVKSFLSCKNSNVSSEIIGN